MWMPCGGMTSAVHWGPPNLAWIKTIPLPRQISADTIVCRTLLISHFTIMRLYKTIMLLWLQNFKFITLNLLALNKQWLIHSTWLTQDWSIWMDIFFFWWKINPSLSSTKYQLSIAFTCGLVFCSACALLKQIRTMYYL